MKTKKRFPFAAVLAGLSGLLLCSCMTTPDPHQAAFQEKFEFQDVSAFHKWTDVLERMDRENAGMIPASYRAPATPDFDTIGKANDIINRYPFIADESRGSSDHWATPREFLANGGGDCEDYAIAKYAMLRELGVQEQAMRIAVVRDLEKDRMHALLLVDLEKQLLILDNQEKDMANPAIMARYQPIFSFNRESWWLY